MPLRFRAVVPYTLPGVLALIGCWWYLSRKKQHAISPQDPDGAPPTAAGLKASLAEGRNGLLESAASPTHAPSEVGGQRAEDGDVSQNALSAEQSSEGDHAERRAGLPSQEDGVRAGEQREPACSSPPAAQLPEAERPEPEGEVALLTEDTVVTCAVTPPPTGKEVDPLETTPSPQEFNQHLDASTPTVAVTAAVRPPASEDRVRVGSEEEQNLELLASGLITEVISAATQEVLGASGRPKCSSTPLGAAQTPNAATPNAATPHHRPLNVSQNGCEEAAAAAALEEMPNGCSPLGHGRRQTNGVQSVQTLDGKLAADEASAPAEDSACSTCHSEDGVSSEELQSSANQTGSIQVTGCSAAESSGAASAEAAPPGEDDAADQAKRLNGLSLRNGGVGNEAETDQSGEAAAAVTSCWD